MESTNSKFQCWLICTSLDNFLIDAQNNFSVEGFKARNRKLVSEVRVGDKFVVYINQQQRFGAVLQAISEPYSDQENRIWTEQEEIWPHRFQTKPIIALGEDELLDAKKTGIKAQFYN